MKSNKLFLKAMGIDMGVEDCTAELLAAQMELWPSCQVLPGVEVRPAFYRHLTQAAHPTMECIF